jgi:hypothetical protein
MRSTHNARAGDLVIVPARSIPRAYAFGFAVAAGAAVAGVIASFVVRMPW